MGGKHNMEDAIQSQIARMFHKGQEGSSGRSSALARDAAETMPMAGDVKRSLRQRSPAHVQKEK
jgi:hypothetical protein